MLTLIYIIVATLVISLSSLMGVITLSFKPVFLQRILLLLVSLSAGTMLGGAFIHLLPEAAEMLEINQTLTITLLSFCFFFLVEKTLHWRHCHKQNCHIHEFGYLNLIGDSIHNFIDGLIIAGSFIVSIPLGLTTTLVIIFHEIPQEIGDFGVLIYSGFKKSKALFLNFLSALCAILGGIIGFLLFEKIENFFIFLLPFAAGGFIYIATSDLIPEIKTENKINKKIIHFLIFISGILLMFLLKD